MVDRVQRVTHKTGASINKCQIGQLAISHVAESMKFFVIGEEANTIPKRMRNLIPTGIRAKQRLAIDGSWKDSNVRGCYLPRLIRFRLKSRWCGVAWKKRDSIQSGWLSRTGLPAISHFEHPYMAFGSAWFCTKLLAGLSLLIPIK
jgi:hypothetical protein